MPKKRDRGKNETLIARREFLKASGAVVVGLGVADVGALAQGVTATAMIRGVTSGPPDEAEVDSFLAVNPDNTVTVYAGYVELGQGGPTALRQIAAEELDVDLAQVITVRMDTFVTTNGFTAASRTAGIGGTQMRAAAAEARRVLLKLASEQLQAPVEELAVAKGTVSVKSAPGRSISYGQLLGDKKFKHRYEPLRYTGGVEQPRADPNNAQPKARSEYKIVGTRVHRPDIEEKVHGTFTFMQHVRVPEMLHARVVWPQGQGGFAVSVPKVVSIDEQSIRDIPEARVVRRQNFVAVVAPREWDAVKASRALKVSWEPFVPVLAGTEGLHQKYRSTKASDHVPVDKGDVESAMATGAHRVTSTYRTPYHSHGTMAPNCAIADVQKDSAVVMCSDQGVYATRAGLSRVLNMPAEKIRVQYYAGSNTYGSSCYREAAQAAAIISQEIGKPVRIQFSRQDEFGWDNYGPAMLADMRGSVDAKGKIVGLDFQAWSHNSLLTETALYMATSTAPPKSAPDVVGGLYQIRPSQIDMYDIPNLRMTNHRLPSTEHFRSGPLRAPMEPAVYFAHEGMMDELAYAAKIDPYEFRKLNISHPRWLGVLKAAADAAKWTPRVAASQLSKSKIVTGRGIGLGTHHLPMNQGTRITHAAAVVDVEVNKDNGIVVAKHIYGAMDCGLAINPGIVESQIVGMSNHGTSIALKEEVQFNSTNVTSLDWNSYHTLRFGEHPTVTPIVVQQLNEQSCGAGEEVLPAVVAAIGNAVFDAIGVRIRQIPITPARVLEALRNSQGAHSA